ncbi:MAG TPA: prolyl oligopeptidase family serine peptidase [Thermoanaerobaculia bacterium]|nr:prolyl oligopeptidase family serine peptidase [Thermoanaerobaculia bacterium]
MKTKTSALIAAGLLIAGAGTPTVLAQAPSSETVPIPSSIVARNVPAIPKDRVADLLPYENIRTASLADWHPTERKMYIRTRFAQSVQLHEVGMPMGDRRQLTFYNDPVISALARPHDAHQVVFAVNEAGAENFQFYLLDRATGRSRRFTDGKSRNMSPRWSRNGKLLAWVGNARNGRDFDLYVADPAKPGSERRVAKLQGSWSSLDWSPDNRRILLLEEISANEAYLHWADVTTGEVKAITPRLTDKKAETVAYQGGRWAGDGQSVFTTTDRDGEFLRLVRLGLDNSIQGEISRDIPWDVEGLDVSEDGALAAFVTNEDGFSKLYLVDTKSGARLPSPELPPGVGTNLVFRPGSHEVGFAVSWARSPSDVYSYDPGSRKLERWTASEVGGLNPEQFVIPELVRYPTFDEAAPGKRRTIPAFVYRPSAERFKGRRPVFIDIHGGPEAQAQPNFLGSLNYLVDELGVALLVPNVRGSSGYGKTYLRLDDWKKREDSVKDIGALLDWIKTQPDLDASRVMVNGGSYGGYMVLAVLVHYGDRIRCAYDTVGISNFVTFLQNTSEYRRDQRRVEYGDERIEDMRAFLETISPARHSAKINRPLLVAQGANDPRVPLSESDQIVAAVEKNGAPVWYVVGKDEGHGFQKKVNTDYMRAVMVEFMRQHLLGMEAAASLR